MHEAPGLVLFLDWGTILLLVGITLHRVAVMCLKVLCAVPNWDAARINSTPMIWKNPDSSGDIENLLVLILVDIELFSA